MTNKNSSLRSKVYQDIRDDILCGNYEQGEELAELVLGDHYGVSRTPVREALRQLALEGLVELIPNKGAYAKGISAKDVEDIYLIRSRLEGLCARWAAEKITPDELSRMEETICLSEFHAGREEYEHVYEQDSHFHELMYEASHSRMLSALLSQYHQYVQKVRKLSIQNHKRSTMSSAEHKKILDAIQSHNGDAAEELATQHVLNTMENLAQYNIDALLHQKEQ
ncbi:MAG: GntR family transcriptional regulator [Lachnospiraceae bacterium]|nr:GntR family transcriptional regulator [Lachnospiraceae bacterium]